MVRLLVGLVLACVACGSTARPNGMASGGDAGAAGSAGESGSGGALPPRSDCCAGEQISDDEYVAAVTSACTEPVVDPTFVPWPGPWAWWQPTLVPHPYVPSVVYALTHDPGGQRPDALFASVDGGVTFCVLPAPPRLYWLVPAVADARVLYAGDELGVLYLSIDAGATWQTRQTQGYQQPVVVDPRSTERLLSAGEVVFEEGEVRVTLKRSEDAGRTWQTLAGPVVGIDTVSLLLAHDSGRPDRLYAAGVSSQPVPFAAPQVGISDDAGQTWRAMALPEGAETPTRLSVASDGRLFVLGVNGRLWSSGADAAGLEDASLPDFAASSWAWSMHAPAMAPSGAVYLAARDNDGGRMAKTTDGGQSWVDVTPPVDVGINLVPVVAHDGAVYVATPVGLRHSPDDGATWQAGFGVPHGALATSPDGMTLLAADAGAVFRSLDGGATWSSGAVDLAGGSGLPGVAPDEPGSLYLGASQPSGAAVLLQSVDAGATWQDSGSLPTGARTLLVAAQGVLFANVQLENDSWLSRSTNGGLTWQTSLADVSMPARSVDGARVYVAQGDGDSCRDIGNDCRSDLLHVSDDLGDSWQFASVGVALGLENGVVRAIAPDAQDPDVVYALLVAGRFAVPEPTQTSLLVSRDGGVSYTLLASLEGVGTPAPLLLATLSSLYLRTDWQGALYQHALTGGSWQQLAASSPGYDLVRAADDSVLLPSPLGFFRYVP